ncbi:hypothetical protein RI367_002450 [Sorochytrium milnesiophthora]
MPFSNGDDAVYYANVDVGWNTVKVCIICKGLRTALNSCGLVQQIVGITIIPYCWCILPSAFLWNVLMFGAVLDLCHVLLVFTAYLVPYFSPGVDVTGVWTAQAIVAGGVRIIEIVYNAKILEALQGKIAWWQYVWFIVTSALIIAGRVLDSFLVSKAAVWQDVRVGMTIVSISGVIAALPVIYALGREVYRLLQSEYYQQSQGRIRIIMQQSSVRLIFLNAIDVGLVFCFLLPNTVVVPFFRWWFDNWDNSRLAYYCLDLLLSRVNMQDTASSEQQKQAVGTTVELKATEFEASSEWQPPATMARGASRSPSKAATELSIATTSCASSREPGPDVTCIVVWGPTWAVKRATRIIVSTAKTNNFVLVEADNLRDNAEYTTDVSWGSAIWPVFPSKLLRTDSSSSKIEEHPDKVLLYREETNALYIKDNGTVGLTTINKVKDIVPGRDLFCFTSDHVGFADHFLHVVKSSSADEVREILNQSSKWLDQQL